MLQKPKERLLQVEKTGKNQVAASMIKAAPLV